MSVSAVRLAMLLVRPEKFAAFCNKVLAQLGGCMEFGVLSKDSVPAKTSKTAGNSGWRLIKDHGQEAGASGVRAKAFQEMRNVGMLMNFADNKALVCLMSSRMAGRECETGAGPWVLEDLSLEGAVIIAAAQNCQAGFIEAVRNGYAHYCSALSGSHDRTLADVRGIFSEPHGFYRRLKRLSRGLKHPDYNH